MPVICFVASKSGGHILPCVTLAHRYKKQDCGYTTALITGKSQLDTSLVEGSFDEKLSVGLQPFLYKKPWRWPSFFISFLSTLWRAHQFLSFVHADRLISTGGFIGVPVSIAAWLLGIPIELYELNAVPGKAAYTISFIATSVRVTFIEALSYFNNAVLVSYPLNALQRLDTQQARKQLHLSSNKKTITILGGSQGSIFINRVWAQWLAEHAQKIRDHYSVIHQHGPNALENWPAFYAHYGIEAYTSSFINDMSCVYSASSCIIARAGAGSLFEIVEFALPALIIPLASYLSTHQYNNAQAIGLRYPFVHILAQETIEQQVNTFYQQLELLLSQSM